MSSNPINTSSLSNKQKALSDYIEHLDGIENGTYIFSEKDIDLLTDFDIKKDGLSEQEIKKVSTRLEALKANIKTFYEDDGDLKRNFDFNGDGKVSSHEIEALRSITEGRLTSSTLRSVSGINANSQKYNFITQGNYQISFGDNGLRIANPQGQLLSTIDQKLGVTENDPRLPNFLSNNAFYIGSDSSFILPDGTKIFISSKDGIASGIVIDDGNKAFIAGTINIGDKKIDSSAKEINKQNFPTDYELLLDSSLADKSSKAGAGVFAWSPAANNNLGGWAIKMPDGSFQDVKRESKEGFLANPNFETEGLVKVTREALLASLDLASSLSIDLLISKGISIGVQNLFVSIEPKFSDKHKANLVILLNKGVTEASLSNYLTLIRNNKDTALYDQLIESGASKEVIESIPSLSSAPANKQAATTFINKNRSDLSTEAKQAYVSLLEQATTKTAFNVLNSVILLKGLDSDDVLRFANLAKDKNNLSELALYSFASLLSETQPTKHIEAYEQLLRQDSSLSLLNGFTSLLRDPSIPAKDAVLSAYTSIASKNPEALSHLIKISKLNDAAKITKLADLVNAGKSNTMLSAYTELALDKASDAAFTALDKLKDPQIQAFMDLYKDPNITAKDTVLSAYGLIADKNPEALSQLIQISKLNEATKITKFAELVNAGKSTAMLSAYTELALGKASDAAFTALDKLKDPQIQAFMDLYKDPSITAKDTVLSAYGLIADKNPEALNQFTQISKLKDAAKITKFAELINAGKSNTMLGAYTELALSKANDAAFTALDKLKDAQIPAFMDLYKDPNITAKDTVLSAYGLIADKNPEALKQLIQISKLKDASQISTFAELVVDPSITNKNSLLVAYVSVANKNPEALKQLIQISKLNDAAKITKFAELVKADKSNTMLSAYTELALGKASDAAFTALDKLKDTYIQDFMDLVNNTRVTAKDTVLGAYASIATKNPKALELLISLSTLTDASKITKLAELVKTGKSNTMLSAYTELVMNKASDATLAALDKVNTDAQVQKLLSIFKDTSIEKPDSVISSFVDLVSKNHNRRLAILDTLISSKQSSKIDLVLGDPMFSEESLGNLAKSRNGSKTINYLINLTANGIGPAPRMRLIELANKGVSAQSLEAFSLAHISKEDSNISAINSYIDLKAGDLFLSTFSKILRSTASSDDKNRVTLANTAIDLNKKEKSRNVSTGTSLEIKIAKFVHDEILRLSSSITSHLLTVTPRSQGYDSGIITKITEELAKLSNAPLNKETFIKIKSIEHMLANGVTELDASAQANILKQVDAILKSKKLVATTLASNSAPKDPLQNTMSILVSQSDKLKQQLANLPKTSRSVPRLLQQLSSYDNQIKALQIKIDAAAKTTAPSGT